LRTDLTNDEFVLLAKHNYSELVKENEMGGACGTHGREGMHTGFWWETQKEIDHYKDLDVGGRIMRWIVEKIVGWYALH
jgi:hypothetical protein